jgi:hypothetical protein
VAAARVRAFGRLFYSFTVALLVGREIKGERVITRLPCMGRCSPPPSPPWPPLSRPPGCKQSAPAVVAPAHDQSSDFGRRHRNRWPMLLARPEPSSGRVALLGGGGAPSPPARCPAVCKGNAAGGWRGPKGSGGSAGQARADRLACRAGGRGAASPASTRGARACRLRRRWRCTALNDAVRVGLALGHNNGRVHLTRERILLVLASMHRQKRRIRLGGTPISPRQMSCQRSAPPSPAPCPHRIWQRQRRHG